MRHGATPWNAGGRFQGVSDVALSELGFAQAAAISRRLEGERIDRLYSSDLSRALETARVIARQHDIEPIPDSRLREFHFGEWESLTWGEIARRHPELGNDATAARRYAPPGGETFDAVRVRVRHFLDEVLPVRAQDRAVGAVSRHVAVVTHAGVLHATLAELGLSAPRESAARFSPAGITRIAIDENRSAALLAFDDLSHLSQ